MIMLVWLNRIDVMFDILTSKYAWLMFIRLDLIQFSKVLELG